VFQWIRNLWTWNERRLDKLAIDRTAFELQEHQAPGEGGDHPGHGTGAGAATGAAGATGGGGSS
jgi:hypothetical protein